MSLNPIRVPIKYQTLPDKTLGYITHILTHSTDVINDLEKLKSTSPEHLNQLIEALVHKFEDLEVCDHINENSKLIQNNLQDTVNMLQRKLDISRNAIKKLESIPLLLNTQLSKETPKDKIIEQISTLIESQIEKSVEGLTDLEWNEKQEKMKKIFESIPISPTDLLFEGKRIGDDDENELTKSINPF